MKGPLLKRSDFLKSWREREVRAARTSSDHATLSWHGPDRTGHLVIDSSCTARVEGDRLIVSGRGREVQFKQAPGGRSVDAWYAHIVALQSSPMAVGGAARVTALTETGVATLCRLEVGDELLAVNEQAVADHEQGTLLLVTVVGELRLRVRSVRRGQPPSWTEVRVDKPTVDAKLGITLSSPAGGGATIVTALTPDGIATQAPSLIAYWPSLVASRYRVAGL